MYFSLLKQARIVLSPEDRAERDKKIIELYQQGKSMNQVAFELGINRGTVNGTLRRTNTPRRSRGMPSEVMKQMLEQNKLLREQLFPPLPKEPQTTDMQARDARIIELY